MNSVLHHSCGVLVYFENESGDREYLLLRYPEGHWDFVKGHIDDVDSDMLATAKRELLEETGIAEIEINAGFEKTMNYSYRRDGVLHEKRVDFFLGKVKSKNVILSHEHNNFDWKFYSEAINQVTFENAKEMLIAAELFLTGK